MPSQMEGGLDRQWGRGVLTHGYANIAPRFDSCPSSTPSFSPLHGHTLQNLLDACSSPARTQAFSAIPKIIASLPLSRKSCRFLIFLLYFTTRAPPQGTGEGAEGFLLSPPHQLSPTPPG